MCTLVTRWSTQVIVAALALTLARVRMSADDFRSQVILLMLCHDAGHVTGAVVPAVQVDLAGQEGGVRDECHRVECE